MKTKQAHERTFHRNCGAGDLPSLASHAAIELDNLALGRESDLDVVSRLAGVIGDSVVRVEDPTSPHSRLDPTTALVMNSAIVDAQLAHEPLTMVSELVSKSGSILATLERVATQPHPDLEDVRRMRTFCVALSKHASECMHPWEESEPRHPFRS